MSLLLALGYMISSLFGIGVLLLPRIVQQIGVGYFILALTFVAVLLNLVAYIILELIQITGEDVRSSVEQFLGKAKGLVPVFLGIFMYSALTAYVVAAGDQVFALFGGNPRLWSTLFFVLAAIPAVKGLTIAARTSMYLAFFLIGMILFILPVNLKFSTFVPPVYGTLNALSLFLVLAVFSLAGHFAISEVHKLVRDEKKEMKVFFISFAFAFISYIAFGITASGVSSGISELSTAYLAQIFPPIYSLLISFIALIAFYTSFITISHSFIKTFSEYAHKRSIYALLLIPIAILYLLVREYNLLTLTSMVGRLGGTSFLFFLSLACLSHNRASRKWKVKFPPFLSLVLSAVFAIIGVIGIFV